VRDDRRAERPARPSVSVVVPARNEEATLGACLASIRAQQPVAGGIEIVVVENGSRDGTRAVADAVAAEDPRVRVVASGARNQAEAMNDGILAARGDVIARVDAHSASRRTISAAWSRRSRAIRARPASAARSSPPARRPSERAIGHARSSPLGVGGGYGADRDATEHPVRSVQCGAYWRERLLEAGPLRSRHGVRRGRGAQLAAPAGRVGRRAVSGSSPAVSARAQPRCAARAVLALRAGPAPRACGSIPASSQARHLAPSALVVVLSVLLLGTLLGSARAWSGLLFVGGSWLVVLVAAGLLALRRAPANEAAWVPLAVACMHLGYGPACSRASSASPPPASREGPGPLPLAEPPG
jgi:hypothetical protein